MILTCRQNTRRFVAALAAIKLSLPASRVGLERIVIDVGDGRGIARASTTKSDGNVPSIAAEKMYVVDDLVVNDAFGLYLLLSASKPLTLDKPATRTITRLQGRQGRS